MKKSLFKRGLSLLIALLLVVGAAIVGGVSAAAEGIPSLEEVNEEYTPALPDIAAEQAKEAAASGKEVPPAPNPSYKGAAPTTYTTMYVNTSYTASITAAGSSKYYKFVPGNTGTYVFTSSATGSVDPYGYLLNSSGTAIAANDDYSGRNFRISYTLTAGVTYYLQTRLYSSAATGSYPVRVDYITTWPPSYTSMVLNTSYTASVTLAGMEKWYRFIPAASGNYTFSSAGTADSYGYLYNSSGSLLASNDDGGTNLNFSITASLTAGTVYYLKVRLYSGSSTGSFTVSVTTPFPPSSYTTMYANTTYSCTISPAGVEKWYRFTATASGTHVFTSSYTSSSTTSTDPYGYVYNSSGSLLAYNDDYSGRNFRISVTLTAGQVYYLKVRLYSSSATGTFGVSVTPPASTWPPSATTMSLNTNYTANISSAGSVLYFKYTAAMTGTHTFNSAGSVDPYGYLLNSSGTQLAANDDSNGGSNFTISYNLTAGQTYYLKVRLYSSSSTGSFTVKVATLDVTVTFNAMGGAVSPTSKTVTPGAQYGTLPTPTDAVNRGYSFSGWYTASSGGTRITASSYVPSVNAGNHTLYAQYAWPPASSTTITTGSSYTASIDTAGRVRYFKFIPSTSATYSFTSAGSYDTNAYLYNSAGGQLAYNDDGGTNTNFNVTYALTAGTTYYLKVRMYSSSQTGSFTVSVAQGSATYTVSYNANGGTGAPAAQTKTHGVTLTLSSTRPTYTGKTFLGWATSPNATTAQYQPGGSYTANAAVTLYAVWQTEQTALALTQNEIYSFVNIASAFTPPSNYNVLARDFNRLTSCIRSYYSTSNANTIIGWLTAARSESWKGSCYGMAMTAILDKKNMIGLNENFDPGAANLWQVDKPKDNSNVQSAINYYQISQSTPTGFTRPATVWSYASNYAASLQSLVNEAKAGKLIEFSYFIDGWGGHAIVIVGYRAGANGSHDLITWNNWYNDFRDIVNISSDYKTCTWQGQTIDGVEWLSDFTNLNRIDIDGSGNNMVYGATAGGSVDLATTQVKLPMGSSISITNEEGQSIYYNSSTGEFLGDIAVLSEHMVVNSTVEDGVAPADIIIEIPNSSTFTIDTEGGMDVSLVNADIYAAASSADANELIVSNAEGVYLLGELDMEYTISCSVNSPTADSVTVFGAANGNVSLTYKGDDVVIDGAYGQTTVTAYSSSADEATGDFIYAQEDKTFNASANDTGYLVCATPEGDLDIMYSTDDSGTFNSAVGGSSAAPADKATLLSAITAAKDVAQEDYSDASFKALSDALAAAQDVSADSAASQTAVDTATQALNAAINALVPLGDSSTLAARVTALQGTVNNDYTSATWNTFTTALNNAKAVVANSDASEAQVAQALTALNNAYAALAKNQRTVTVSGGSGSTTSTAGTVINISAPATTSGGNDGKVFDRWVVSGSGSVANPTSPSTTFTVGAGNATVTATYKDADCNHIFLWGKHTKYENNFINWLLVIVCFGWIWMAF
jgi:uncharacterized repeat protein (TIGR02543 family)